MLRRQNNQITQGSDYHKSQGDVYLWGQKWVGSGRGQEEGFCVLANVLLLDLDGGSKGISLDKSLSFVH